MTWPVRPQQPSSSGTQTLTRRPGVAIMPATTSTGANGWNISGGTLSASLNATNLSGTTGVMTRITGSNGGVSDSFPYLRRSVNPDSLTSCCGKIEFPVYVPPGMGTGFTIKVRVSSAAPGNNPPTVNPTNYADYLWQPSQFKQGQIQMLGIDFNAGTLYQPDLLDGTGVVVTGTGADYTQIKEIDLSIFIPHTGTDYYVDVGDITSGAKSTPFLMINFDGAGSDTSHYALVAPILERYGLKATFSPQGQVITSYLPHLQRLYAAGHDISNEGLNHTNYKNSPSTLLADAATTANVLISNGMQRGAYIFTAPQNALSFVGSGSPGISDLFGAGFKYIRTGNRWNIPTPASGMEAKNFGAFTGDLATSTSILNYVDNLILHGESGMLLFHSVIDNTLGASASGTQINLTEFATAMARISTLVGSGAIGNVTCSQFATLTG